jgi:membrane protein
MLGRGIERLRALAHRSRSSFAGELLRDAKRDRITGLSAEVAFFMFLSLVPGLVAVVASLAFTDKIFGADLATRAEETLMTFLGSVLTERATPAIDLVRELFDREQPGLLSVAMAGTVWAFSRGLLGVISALEIAYELPPASWWKRRARAVLLALGTIVALALVLAIVAIGPLLGLLGLLLETAGLDAVARSVQWLRFPLAFTVLAGWACWLYRAGPALRTSWRSQAPGAILAAGLWLVVSLGFLIYLELAGGVNQVFGVLGGILILIVWLYLLSLSLLAGGEFNAVLQRRAAGSPPAEAPEEASVRGRTDEQRSAGPPRPQ